MSLKTFLLLLVFALLSLFAILNWNAFMVPTNLWLVFDSINAPLGLIMLGFTALISLLFLIVIAYLQASHLSEARRFNKEVHSLRELAEQSEQSRFTELREFLTMESAKMEGKANETQVLVQTRLDKLDRDLREAIEQTGNTLAAYMGELEDNMTKK